MPWYWLFKIISMCNQAALTFKYSHHTMMEIDKKWNLNWQLTIEDRRPGRKAATRTTIGIIQYYGIINTYVLHWSIASLEFVQEKGFRQLGLVWYLINTHKNRLMETWQVSLSSKEKSGWTIWIRTGMKIGPQPWNTAYISLCTTEV